MLSSSLEMPLPVELQVGASRLNKKQWIGGSVAVVAVLIFLAIIWWQSGPPASSAPLETATKNSGEMMPGSPTEKPVQATATAASVPTPTVSFTATSTVAVIPSEVPIGVLPPTATLSTSETNPQPTTCAPPAGWVVYVVRSGDTLSSIGQLYRVSVRDLQAGNCMGTSATIFVNQKLYVPNVPTITPANQPTSTPTQVSPTSPPPTDTPTLPPSRIPDPTSTPTDTVEPKTYP